MNTSALFNEKSDLYAASRPMYPKELYQFIASLAKSHASAWDCATGNGQAAKGLSEYFTEVEATDISDEQINHAFYSENINYSVQASESTTFQDSQFDLVNVAQALHWFDYDRYWDEVARVLKPDGVFVAVGYVWPEIDKPVSDVLEEYILNIIEPYWAPNNKLLWDNYRSLKLPFQPIATPEIHMKNHWDLVQFLDYIHTWSATRQCIKDIGQDFFDTARERFKQAWGNPNQRKSIHHPLIIIAGSAWTR